MILGSKRDLGACQLLVFLGPLSEFYGRKPVYIVSYFFFLSISPSKIVASNSSMANTHSTGPKHRNHHSNVIPSGLLRR